MEVVIAVIALGVWIYLMDRWAKSNAKPLIDLTPLEEWLERNWAPILMVSGAVIVLWGLSGWQVGAGLSSSDRTTLIIGAALVGIGWLSRRP